VDFEHVDAPTVDDLWDAKDRVQREVAAEVFTAPAPLDPSGRHELAADFFHAKTGTAASYFTVDLSPEGRAPYYAAADAFLAAHLTPEPEPEPEWAPGTVADIEVGGDMQYRAIRTDDLLWSTESHWSYEDAEVTDVRPLVVLDPESDTDRLAAIISSHRHGSEVPWPEDRRTAEAILQRLSRSEEHTSELQSRENLVCRLLLEKKKLKS